MRAETIAWRLVTLLLLATCTGAVVYADEGQHAASPPAGGGDIPSMLRFYAGSPALTRTGDFPGKLVCLRCDLKPGPDAMAQCEKEGHRHALSMDRDAMIHPLIAGSEPVLKQINSAELHGKDVVVHGKYYPATGIIFVDRISIRSEPR